MRKSIKRDRCLDGARVAGRADVTGRECAIADAYAFVERQVLAELGKGCWKAWLMKRKGKGGKRCCDPTDV